MSLRLVLAQKPHEACENVALRQMLARLTYGTHERGRGFVLRPSESQALYAVLAHRMFSPIQLDQVARVIRWIDPRDPDSPWNDPELEALVDFMRSCVDKPEWIDHPLKLLDAAMRSQGETARFHLWFTRAVLTTFLTVDALPREPEELLHLAG